MRGTTGIARCYRCGDMIKAQFSDCYAAAPVPIRHRCIPATHSEKHPEFQQIELFPLPAA